MSIENTYKIKTKHRNLFLRVSEGHFATSHSHINYYIDVTTHKTRLSEASALATELVGYYNNNTIVDTVLCLDGTEVIGTCLASELTKGAFRNMNAHQTIYVITPERTSESRIIFRDNLIPMIKGKNILILADSVVTGFTAQAAIEAVKYYGGVVSGVCAIFATMDECAGYKVCSVFNPNDLGNYATYPSQDCPLCKKGEKIEALVNSFGYSKL